MLDGKEVDVPIGKYGHASLDIDDSGNVDIAIGVKINIIEAAKGLAAQTKTPLDDQAIAWLEKLVAAKKALGGS